LRNAAGAGDSCGACQGPNPTRLASDRALAEALQARWGAGPALDSAPESARAATTIGLSESKGHVEKTGNSKKRKTSPVLHDHSTVRDMRHFMKNV
jgi:type IV secretory pathway VirD2 relaxase